MHMFRSAAIAAALAALAVPAGASTTFDFFWTGDPVADPSIFTSPDATARAEGTIVIDALPGEAFTLADILSTSITVTGAGFSGFTFTSWNSAAGTIAADGLSAVFTVAGNPFHLSGNFFGCLGGGCGDSTIRARQGGDTFDFVYGSPAEALASMRMTAQVGVIPLPATLPLLLGALGLLAVARRKAA
jgi:hypothetical protein